MKFSAERKLALAAAATIMALGCSNLAKAETPSWCGPKIATLGLTDGFGGNSWRLVTTASGARRGEQVPERDVAHGYADGQGNTQKAISDIQGMVAKGVNALVVFPDAGKAILPALTSAYKAGVVTVPYRVHPGRQGRCQLQRLHRHQLRPGRTGLGQVDPPGVLPKGGNVLMISGPQGNSQGIQEEQTGSTIRSSIRRTSTSSSAHSRSR